MLKSKRASSSSSSDKVTLTVQVDKKVAKDLLKDAEKKRKPKKKVKPKEKAKVEPQKPTVPECALGKGFGYLRTLEKHDVISDKCYSNCPREVREACLDPRKTEKLLKEMRKT